MIYLLKLFLFQNHIPHTKAQVLSRRVWDILTLLPTSPILLRGFQEMATTPNNMKLSQFIDPTSPQKLMYSLYIVESLSRPSKKHRLVSKLQFYPFLRYSFISNCLH